MLKFTQNVKLSSYTTIKVGLGRAKYLVKITEAKQIPELYQFAKDKNLPVIVLGEGSNSIMTDQDIEVVVAINQIKGIEQDGDIFVANSGEMFDDLVQLTAQQNYSGIECLSNVPGTVGAGPIQNVGAYGQEVADTMTKLEAYDSQTNQFVELDNADCQFSYRDSIFKNQARGRYFITKVYFKLNKNILQPPFYNSLQSYIDNHQITDFSPANLAKIIKIVRDSKIPDYKLHPSAGSFFQNCLLEPDQFEQFYQKFPDAPYSNSGDKIKIPTGWLLEKAKLKGKRLHGFEINRDSALILINRSGDSFADLTKATEQIKQIIFDQFGLKIKQEPIIIGEQLQNN